MFSKGVANIDYDIIENIPQEELVRQYLGDFPIPSLINSPFRKDRKPSFSLFYSKEKKCVLYKDFSTGESGNIFTLLSRLWSCTINECYQRIIKDNPNHNTKKFTKVTRRSSSEVKSIEIKVRNFTKEDTDYWGQYGIPQSLLEWADVYPISHYVISYKNNKSTTIACTTPTYAYAYFDKDTPHFKIYSPYNAKYKWFSNYKGTFISLLDKIPPQGDTLLLTSSLKDSLCVISNLGIPCINLQGEGYDMDMKLVDSLKKRFKSIYILYDNDEPGLYNTERMSLKTGFKPIILPRIFDCKDISDLYKVINNKQEFNKVIKELLWKEK